MRYGSRTVADCYRELAQREAQQRGEQELLLQPGVQASGGQQQQQECARRTQEKKAD